MWDLTINPNNTITLFQRSLPLYTFMRTWSNWVLNSNSFWVLSWSDISYWAERMSLWSNAICSELPHAWNSKASNFPKVSSLPRESEQIWGFLEQFWYAPQNANNLRFWQIRLLHILPDFKGDYYFHFVVGMQPLKLWGVTCRKTRLVKV
jgi:hypothetical protein